jgi:opacity protein-like surface antigen
MKRILLASTLALLAFSASAVVGHNGSDGDLGITSSSSASEAVSPNGTRWSSTFSETAIRNTSTGVNSYEFSGSSVNFSGVFRAPTPCHALNSEVKEGSENSYRFIITSEASSDDDQVCAQVISYRGYNASFQTDEPFELEVVHENESVETLKHPDLDTAEPEPEPRPEGQNNPISKLVNWVKSLFSGGPEPVE